MTYIYNIIQKYKIDDKWYMVSDMEHEMSLFHPETGSQKPCLVLFWDGGGIAKGYSRILCNVVSCNKDVRIP